jgi:hypothetical protein
MLNMEMMNLKELLMKKIRLVNYNTRKNKQSYSKRINEIILNKGKYFVNISPVEIKNYSDMINSKKQVYLLVSSEDEIVSILLGDNNELSTLMLRIDSDHEEVIDMLVKFMVSKAKKRRFIKIFIYASTAYTKIMEKFGFIKRRVFFDNDKQMFKII